MSMEDEMNKHMVKTIKKMLPNLVIDWIIPLIVYFILQTFTNDLIALIFAWSCSSSTHTDLICMAP